MEAKAHNGIEAAGTRSCRKNTIGDCWRRLLAVSASSLNTSKWGHASRSSGAPEAGTGARICRPLM